MNCARLLESAATVGPEVLPMLAIGAFAGLREAEIQRLDWSEVDLARGHIEVKAAKAKSARRRIIPAQRNLAAWLQPYGGNTGAVVLAGPRRKPARVREAAKLVRWPNNGFRHSFASYRLAEIHDAPRVAMDLGHTSPQMLFSTCREVVRPERGGAVLANYASGRSSEPSGFYCLIRNRFRSKFVQFKLEDPDSRLRCR